jgi:hypothetical protein
MKRIAIALFAVVMGAGLMVQDAEAAKRLGGGKSTGVSRDSTVMKREAIPAKPAAAPAATAAAAQRRRRARRCRPIRHEPLDGPAGRPRRRYRPRRPVLASGHG